jgi:hypothetical protein
MAYLRDSVYTRVEKGSTFTKNFISIIIFFVFALIVLLLRKYFFTPAMPVLHTINSADSFLYGTFSKKPELVKKIKELKSENEELRLKIADYAKLENENLGLRGLKESNEINFISVLQVYAKPGMSSYDTFITEKTTDDFIGFPVLTLSGMPLGTVAKVYKNGSIVELYSQNKRETKARLFLDNALENIDVTLMGNSGSSFVARVPKNTIVPIGSLVYVAPYEKPIAKVVNIETIEDTQELVLTMSYAQNINYISHVGIFQ